MYGRGAAVSKSDFATYTFALRALQDAAAHGAKLGGAVELHFTYDEESGGDVGPRRLLDEGLTKPDFVIAAGFSYAGVMVGVELSVDGSQIVDQCLQRRLLINCTHGTVLRLLPALNLTDDQLHAGCDILEEVLLSYKVRNLQ